jgi:hypothetical protein
MNFILSFLSLIGQKIVVLESAVNIFTNVITVVFVAKLSKIYLHSFARQEVKYRIGCWGIFFEAGSETGVSQALRNTSLIIKGRLCWRNF